MHEPSASFSNKDFSCVAAVRYQVQAKYFKDKNRDKRILYKQHDKAINDTSSNSIPVSSFVLFIQRKQQLLFQTLCDTGKLMATLQTTVFSIFSHFVVFLQLKKRYNR